MTSGDLLLEDMQRLRDRLLPPYGEVSVELEFIKEGRRNRLNGSIIGHLVVECQRCMESMLFDVNHQFKLAFVHSEAEVDTLLPGDEPCLISDDEDLHLSDIIEDELELLLPMIVMHKDENCNKSNYIHHEDAHDAATEKESPFSVLADLKK